MRLLLDIQKKLLPDVLDIMVKRFRILQFIRLMEPIGRRSLSSSLDISERVLRSEVTFLKEQGLLNVASAGMSLSSEGKTLLLQLEEVMKELLGLKVLEQRLSETLQVDQVIVLPGNSDEFPWVKKEMGRACVAMLKKKFQENDVVAVTGGTTLASVAEMMTPESSEVTFVPARGGIGEQMENQANTISARMAQNAEGSYRLLHVPDQLSEEAYLSLISEPSVKEVIELIKASSIVIHGIGEATTMASRRGSPESIIKKIKAEKAVAEAFGYYFDKSGDIIHRERTIGLQLEDLNEEKYVIAVAGGTSKAEAISAYMNYRPSHVLITDEAAAKTLLNVRV
ncbi:sugar-binding transcriptional regulator [Bacillus sp. FJAT-45350]|uniref:sugar-binding transcriptional regulator n=1 Tax=Bacillus sp. FJAT-45350 TaxID=2011014 RepID=UPI000BB90645|nr:sugar-binding domain-containing protein [Bacillus sp. FJAT-45350]